MKIVLFSPQSPAYRKGGVFGKALRYAPLTLTTLAALVPVELGAEIVLIDEVADEFDAYTIEADIVGITIITPNAPYVYETAKILRERGIVVVLGGPHPTLIPDEAQLHCDSVVVGYAEQTWPQLLRDFVQGQMKPRYVEGEDYTFAGLPLPRRDLLNTSAYRTISTVQAVRGCPWKCDFCVVPAAWPKYMHRPVEEVVHEISLLPDEMFLFLDLSPTENRRYILELYQALTPLKKKWGGLATIRIAKDEELLTAAAASGCRGLLIGFESMSPDSIAQMNKGFNDPVGYYDAVARIHDHGIAINGCFVLGNDGDTEGIFDQTLEFIDRAAIDLPRVSIVTPFPNTPFYHRMVAQDRLITNDWRYYGGQNVVFKPAQMSVERLQEGLHYTWEQAYSLGSIWRRLRSPAAHQSWLLLQTYLLTNLGYRYYGKWLPDFMPTPCEPHPQVTNVALEIGD